MAGALVAELGYLGDPHKADDGKRLHYYADFTRTTNALLSPHAVQIEDARANPDGFSLDREGFALTRWPTGVADFMDTQAIEPQYVAECEELIRQLTGAEETCNAGPIHCRFDNSADPMGRYDGKPAHYVHGDFSEDCARRALEHVERAIANAPRRAIYNIWRVLTPPPQSRPLAVCDASSIAPEDDLKSLVILSYPDGREVEALTTLYKPNPRHRWFYFSDMSPDEVLVFKSFDSDPARASRVPHCAFVDGGVAPGAARVSVEARVCAGYAAVQDRAAIGVTAGP